VSLSDRLSEASPSRPGKPCGISRVLSELSDEDADALEASMRVPVGDPQRLSSQQISSILKLEGHNVSLKTVELHRKGSCRCVSRG